MGKNKNKRNRQNSAGSNKFGSGPFNKKFKQDSPMNKGQQNQGMNKNKGGFSGGNKFDNREKSAGSNKFGPGPFNKKFKQDNSVSNGQQNQSFNKNKGTSNGGSKFDERLVNEKSAFSVKKELMQSPDISTNKGAVHSPDKKKVKFDTLSDSSSGENELNASKKSDIVFDENGSLNDSDMEDESDFEDFEDEEDLDSLMGEEDDSLMEDEDDSLSLDEVKNFKKDALLSSKGGKTLADSKKEETTKKEISKKVELPKKPVETKNVEEKPVEAKPAEENKMEEVVHDGYMFYCRSLAEFMRALPKKKEVEFRMEVEKLKLNFIDE